MISAALSEYLNELKDQGLTRKRLSVNENGADERVNFSSSDYLSLTQDPRIKKAFQKGFNNYSTGSGGSMVICGYHESHRTLERAFAEALKADDALLFSSGYTANLGIIALLAQFNAQIIIDKAAHASFYDGLRMSGCDFNRYLPNNLSSLAKILPTRATNPVVISESVFSMSGQATELSQLSKICANFDADCIIDEAHAFGVFGPQGLGGVVQHGLNQDQIPLRIVPLGKAFAFQGAMVVGKSDWIEGLLQLARSHRYSTAVSPALAYGLTETLSIIRAADDRRQKLYDLIIYFQSLQKISSLTWRDSSTPIQQLQLGCPIQALECSSYLSSKGIFCQAMRAPTVSKKETGLRVLLNYHHSQEDIDRLFSLLHQFFNKE
ncbi:MAG: aminotransferase class I/II-fold pyridoxal phosphate-dependent enzyme [Tatlockia sp.]|nr:aminotransferase class I/II-fold pyridoxal phosphate-dependent enzyme [Tatlockia sp.]